MLFECGDPADDIYILERGSVLCAVDFTQASVHSRASTRALAQQEGPGAGATPQSHHRRVGGHVGRLGGASLGAVRGGAGASSPCPALVRLALARVAALCGCVNRGLRGCMDWDGPIHPGLYACAVLGQLGKAVRRQPHPQRW